MSDDSVFKELKPYPEQNAISEPKFKINDLVFLTLAKQIGIVEMISSMPGHYRIKHIGTVPETELRSATAEEIENFKKGIRNYPL